MGLFKLGKKKEQARGGWAERAATGGDWDKVAAQGQRTEASWDNMAQDVEAEKQRQALIKHQKRILAHMSGRGFDNWEQVTKEDLDRVKAQYQDRQAFYDGAEELMDAVKRGNSEQKYNQYIQALGTFADSIYGEQTEVIRNDAGDRTEIIKQPAAEQVDTRSEYERNLEKLKDVELSGDGYRWQGQEYFLTREALAQCDLAPDSMIEVGGRQIQMSKAFKVGERDAVIGYVRDDEGKLQARSYYRSNSQGLWRYLPDYAEREDGSGGVGWYGKGISEAALTLPAELQMALNYQASARPQAEIGNTSTEFLLAGTAKRYASKDEYRRMLQFGQLRGDLYREVNYNASYQFGKLTLDKDVPESLGIGLMAQPNFAGGGSVSYRMNSALAGPTRAEVFDSTNGDLKWTMCTDQYGRSWIGNVETNAPVTSTGCRSEWVEPGDLATPLYEYRKMADGYGDERDTRGGRGQYVCMWNNYLSRVPVIRDYMASQNIKRKVGR